MASEYRHTPVLLSQCLEHMRLEPGAKVVDGTLGGAGHASQILEQIGPDGILVGLDLDADALAAAAARLSSAGVLDPRVQLVHASFRDLGPSLAELGIERVDAVLLDLGVSSWQLDAPERGFRFRDAEHDPAPLDMRMDTSSGRPAREWLRKASRVELERCFREYGEVPGAARLARSIESARERGEPLETNADLLRVIERAGIGRRRKHHPATLVFQALRIATNDELAALDLGLEQAIAALRPGGRLVVISYHSLEDRRVKHCFRAAAKGCTCPPDIPVCVCGRLPSLRVLTRRPLRPSEDEIEANPRARSARLRAAERLEEAA